MTDTPQAMRDGEALAKSLTGLIKFNAEHYDGTAALLWWSGFIGHIAGSCGASIGPEAARVLGETFQRMVAQIAREKAN